MTNSGGILATGSNSYGIFAQSVSGGGGNASYSISAPAWLGAGYQLNSTLGGSSNGTAGTVEIDNSGNVEVTGANSHALLGQSVSGGGGNLAVYLDFSNQAINLGTNVSPEVEGGTSPEAAVTNVIALGAQNINQVSGAEVSATTIGDYVTAGSSSFASLLQSLGGGGGNATSTTVLDTTGSTNLIASLGATQTDGSTGGDITASHSGSILHSETNSAGDIVQSIGGGGGTLQAEVDRVAVSESAVEQTWRRSITGVGATSNMARPSGSTTASDSTAASGLATASVSRAAIRQPIPTAAM